MLNRTADVLYCGVSEKKIKEAKPKINDEALRLYVQWVTERYMIRLRKDVWKEPAPWTKDQVLLNYRFCNVRREHDRESIWLIKNICENTDISYTNKVLNSILFRFYSLGPTMEAMFPNLWFDFENASEQDFIDIENCAKTKVKTDPEFTFFTKSFHTIGCRTAARKIMNAVSVAEEKMERWIDVIGILRLVSDMQFNGVVEQLDKAKDQKHAYDILSSYAGIGPFLGYQMFVDLSYIPEFKFSENEFTVAGPGCKKGVDKFFDDRDGMNYEEALFWLRDNVERIANESGYPLNFYDLFQDLSEHDRKANLQQIEDNMCEKEKYDRSIQKTGTPRIKYKESTEPLPGEEIQKSSGLFDFF